MARVKGGAASHARHKKVINKAKGYFGRRKNCYRTAVQAVEKAGQYAYIGRKQKKRNFRSLWIQRITQQRSRPPVLAWYIAASARRRSVSASDEWSGAVATPALKVISRPTFCPAGSLCTSRRTSAMRVMVSSVLAPGSTTTNSSPPKRHTTSSVRNADRRSAPSSTSTSSATM